MQSKYKSKLQIENANNLPEMPGCAFYCFLEDPSSYWTFYPKLNRFITKLKYFIYDVL